MGLMSAIDKISKDRLQPPLEGATVREFENKYSIRLPDDYRRFLILVGNGGQIGPTYGLLPLGHVPAHWSSTLDYSRQLPRTSSLESEWVWEDDPGGLTEEQSEQVENGVLLLGEEGCGARWCLIVNGKAYGQVWLFTGEGVAPVQADGFEGWLEKRLSGSDFLYALVENWGPVPNTWWASHSIIQMTMGNKKGVGFANSHPLCSNCVAYLSQSAAFDKREFAVRTPDLDLYFQANGSYLISAGCRQCAPGRVLSHEVAAGPPNRHVAALRHRGAALQLHLLPRRRQNLRHRSA
jgi:hypothetical protein